MPLHTRGHLRGRLRCRRVQGSRPSAAGRCACGSNLGYHYATGGDPAEVRSQVAWTLDRAVQSGFASILKQQGARVGRFWSYADIELEGAAPRLQQVIRWNLFQLMQATERAEGHGIGARGLTGQQLRGALLLGYRDLRPALPHLYTAADRRGLS